MSDDESHELGNLDDLEEGEVNLAGMTEEEQIAFALQMSMADQNNNNGDEEDDQNQGGGN